MPSRFHHDRHRHFRYGLAVTGVNIKGTLPVTLEVDASQEPNVRVPSTKPSLLTGTVTVAGLTKGGRYTLYRYNGTASLPLGAPFSSAFSIASFTADDKATWTYTDPTPIPSDSATYYVAAVATDQ